MTKLAAIANAFGRSRMLAFTTPEYNFDSDVDGYLHVYRSLSGYIRVTLLIDASSPGSIIVSIHDYDGAGGPTGAAIDSVTFTYGTGQGGGTKQLAVPTDQEFVVKIPDSVGSTITYAILWEMPFMNPTLGVVKTPLTEGV